MTHATDCCKREQCGHEASRHVEGYIRIEGVLKRYVVYCVLCRLGHVPLSLSEHAFNAEAVYGVTP